MRREDKIILQPTKNGFTVLDRNLNVLLNDTDDFYIYMKSVNLRQNGNIEGRYLGNFNDNILDGYCRDLSFDGENYLNDGEVIRTVRMLAVKNQTKQVIVIQTSD